MTSKKICIILLLFQFTATGVREGNMAEFSPQDPSSFSRPDLVLVTDLSLDLTCDFNEKVFRGSADLTVKRIDPQAKEVILDSDNLNISAIKLVTTETADVNLPYELSEPVGEYGSKLTIQLPQLSEDNDTCVISVKYVTSPKASGFQWLEPEQTSGKTHPYVFSQFQPIHARSALPCQDTPAVKTTYKALITVPSEFTAVMSSPRRQKRDEGNTTSFFYVQTVPIPSYLIAIAVGVIESRQIGPRSHVWAEKEVVDKAAYEFADTEMQLKTAEDICGPYVWGIYDLLVLPASFPFGGMENPCLTFVTPTLLAGDRSLANVVAHEIAHSWTGNLVTNRNFEHFWLNEGFTMFIERKIVGRLTTPKEQDFEAHCGVSELRETINLFGEESPLTSLVVNLKGVHPDDAFSRVPYEKGHTFLRYLESVVGGPSAFEPFLRSYFDTFKYKSIDTNDFKSFFLNHFAENASIKQIDWETWLYKPGMPPVIPHYDQTLMEVCITYKERWLEWEDVTEDPPYNKTELKELSVNQIIQLLQEIFELPPQNISKLRIFEKLFKFDTVENSEIKFRWLRICLKAHWEDKVPVALEWLNSMGRMKFVRPLYRDLYEWERIRGRAIDNFKENRDAMMHVTAYTVSKDLHLQ